MNNDQTNIEIAKLSDEIHKILYYVDKDSTVLIAKNLIQCLTTAKDLIINLDERLKKLENWRICKEGHFLRKGI